MVRMDKYEEPNEKLYSRTKKNEDLYRDVYLNNAVVDFNKIIDEEILELEEEKESVVELKKIQYVEKNYDINKYLQEKRALKAKDNLPRSLDENIMKSEDEISKLISKIEQKEKEDELFNDLMPDDDETTIIEGNGELNSFVSDDVINNYVMNKDMDETNSFMDLDETKIIEEKKNKKNKKKSNKKVKELPLIIFCSMALILIGVVIYIVIKIF